MQKTEIAVGSAVLSTEVVQRYRTDGVAVTGAVLKIERDTAFVRWSCGTVTTHPISGLAAVVDVYELVGRRAEVRS